MNLADGVQLVSLAVLALLMLGGALGVVLLNNIVYSAFLLGLVFISISGLYILLNAGFVAAAQILIYVGAVNVLILFGIMLVNKRQPFSPVRNAWLGQAATALVCFGLFALLGTMVLATTWPISEGPIAGERAIVIIGKHFFTDFLLPFELASVLLLMALIGAIVLARREFLPEDSSAVQAQQPILTLPERPRELTGVAPGSPERTIASSPGDRNA
ncbi:MAG TPA: NADH-quinone oxidoreductase subunit J [Crinalium sp.]